MSNPYFDEDEQYDMKLGFAISFIIIAMALLMSLSSCSFTKDVQKSTLDSNATKKLDSGAVSKNTSTNVDELEWYRKTLMLFGTKRDTNITNNHIYPPDGSNTSQPQNPAVIYIQEGGKQRKENTVTNYDSTWQARFDSLAVRLEKKDKTSESEFFSPTVILALFGGLALLVIIALIFLQYNMNRNFSKIIQIIKP